MLDRLLFGERRYDKLLEAEKRCFTSVKLWFFAQECVGHRAELRPVGLCAETDAQK